MPTLAELVATNHWTPILRWTARVFICLLAVLAGHTLFVLLIQSELRDANREALFPLVARTESVVGTLDLLDALGPGGCSPSHIDGMRGVALLPDGIHIVMYLDGDRIACSSASDRLAAPVRLSEPDIESAELGLRIWLMQPLDEFGFSGEVGTIAARHNYAVAYGTPLAPAPSENWYSQTIVLRNDDATFVVPDGRPVSRIPPPASTLEHVLTAASRSARTDCDSANLACVVSIPKPGGLLARWSVELGVIAAAVVFVAAMVMYHLETFVRSYWSFERRFLREMSQRIECAYQPILDINSGDIVGCEVLARWRDIDGRLLSPDVFLPIVESRDKTRAFTHAVVDRSITELRTMLSIVGPMQINYNVFPRDFSVESLSGVLIDRPDMPRNATIAIEIIEVEQFDLDALRREIEAFRDHGVRVYIDDFGSGYSNLTALAALPVSGVKLDKSFGMASPDSLEARMLPNTIDLIAAANHQIIVEGVESGARLQDLRNTGRVQMVQGYHFTAPLPADAFLAWVCERNVDTLRQTVSTTAPRGGVAFGGSGKNGSAGHAA